MPVIQAVQTADHFAVATPADGLHCEDWFFCTKEIPADDIESAVRVKGNA